MLQGLDLRGATLAQAGPTLVKDGKVCILSSEEFFRADAIRKAPHVSIGIRNTVYQGAPVQKIIVLYSRDWSLQQIAEFFVGRNCQAAMKLDGGSKAAFRLAGQPRLGNSGFLVTGLAFVRRK
jgi:hypothetical protein